MNNTFIKRLALVLCLLISLIFVFGCNKGGEEPPIEPPVTDENTNPSETQYDYFYFGSYPMSVVADESVKASLNSILGVLPNSSNFNGWTDYEYFISEQKESYSFYKDLTLNGAKYRAVYHTKYRPYSSKLESTLSNSFQDDNGYYINTVYFFKYEPLKWRVLEDKDGEKLLLLTAVIDAKAFQPEYYQHPIKHGFYCTDANGAPNGTFAHSYEYSSVRKYLNGVFYNDAFTSIEQTNIVLSTISNNHTSSGHTASDYDSNDTLDYVYIPSFMDMKNKDYGFNYHHREEDALRKQPYTDYAKCQGAYYDSQEEYKWWLRSSPDYIDKYSRTVQAVGNSGILHPYHYVDYTIMGVVPMMKIYAE